MNKKTVDKVYCDFCGSELASPDALHSIADCAFYLLKRVNELVSRNSELEAENAGLKERVAMLDVTAVFKSLGEMGYIEQTNKLHARIAELEAAQRWIPEGEEE